MAIRVYKKTSAGRRFASVNMHVEVTKKTPEKSLLAPLPKKGGRNNSGKITVRGRGGGAKRQYRRIDFKRRDRAGIVGKVAGVEYDPNRSAHIALIQYADGVKRYIIAPIGLVTGAEVMTSIDEAIDPNPGNAMPLKFIPLGLEVHCIEMQPGRGAQICRSAGCTAKLSNKEGEYATLVMPSGEIRRVHVNCLATIGQVGNIDHQNRRLGKAGLTRHLGRRPITRGVAKSHHAHPLGGGSGRSKGNRPPCGPTGVGAKGGRTRNRKKHSTKLIIRRRRSVRYGQLK
ncbi:MAG: 50S ribosomal protein L2 [Phycisphaeraceae bacterium]|nr:50S ribosomal protein L2 [Phycisphaeraceae bacterium]MBX3359967.1 50S ribosomal protein L2 [Phycisphaeraceae bacterium]MBX3367187.1 50S ribosomal protein L2 [Phycisphaeraceae bacterium]MCW5769887.1 50S ribosomal protein L2 [Phycisphaeraceae bacterium]QYK49463.1 MAG: 50S ribosomal protein L2 [Phycisphaeraceae bacterium]